MPTSPDAHRRSPILLVLAALVAAGCAHARHEEGTAAAGLAADPSSGGGDPYHGATDEDVAPDNPYAERYGDLDAQTTLHERIALYTPDPTETPPPDDPQERYVAMSSDLPAGTVLRITRPDNGRSVIVEVRALERTRAGALEISEAAGRRLGLVDRGEMWADVGVLVEPRDGEP